jgi:hypothetical protein
MAVDAGGRRLLVGHTNGLLKLAAATSGMVLATVDPQYLRGGCTSASFETILKSRKIFCTAGRRIVMFDDLSGNRISFVRGFLGHAEAVARAHVLKGRFLLSVGAGRELFLWNVNQQHPVVKFQLPSDPTVAVDIPEDARIFLVGDVEGRLHFMSVDCPAPMSSFQGIELTIASSVSTIMLDRSTLIVGNMNGYVKVWARKDGRLDEVRRFRAHTKAVISLSFSVQHAVLVTAGLDEEIRVWSLEPFGMIGELGKIWQWQLGDPKTWRSGAAPPDDPRHFAVPEEVVERAAEGRAAAEQEKREEVRAVVLQEEAPPPFSIESFRRGMDILEDLWLSSRNIEKLMTQPPQPVRKTARAFVKQPLPLMDRELHRPQTSNPKVWRPKV